MNLVLDANILFSALIKNGKTRELMLNNELILYAPEFLIQEFMKYLSELSIKVKVSEEELKTIVQELLVMSNVQIIPFDEFKGFLIKAKEFSPDPNDSLYFALAFRLNCGVWSNDKALKNQEEVMVYSTKDLAETF